MNHDATWFTVRVTPGARRDEVITALFAAGADGVQELQDTFVTHAAGVDAAARFEEAARAVANDVTVETEPLAVPDWSERWKQFLTAQQVGSLSIVPTWLAEDRDPATTIVIEPGMAFGTGDHATTRSVIRLLQRAVNPGDRVADLGAGSAVLAIAARKLGATRVAAIELDPDAIENAEANILRNGVADRVALIEGDAAALLPLVAPVHVVTANIISSVLLELLPVIGAALTTGGRAILSGILTAERSMMLGALEREGWRVVDEIEEEEWWSAIVARR